MLVDEDKTLPYPEVRACAQILTSPSRGNDVIYILIGFMFGFIVRIAINVFSKSSFFYNIPKFSIFSIDTSPALLGVSYILSSYIFTSGVLSWFVLILLISY
ncbi:MAG: hypothetical protein N2504_07150 [candidate division WOR-3 bacterium]|nr:hypothetical protein [candidate division WOR-3 bacterium]MCX7948344.1 hypothetical protein [candidate division WOR-3 bacterium]MDW8151245.1 hypothetical protein [candidate division WOR-3 bacterium]